MLIYNSPLFRQAEEECKPYLLPNIKLFEKRTDQQRYDNGYETMRMVVARRLHSLGLLSDDLFEDGVLDRLILKSGGVVRWLIWLVQDACTAAELMSLERVSNEAAQTAIDDRVAQLSGCLT